MALDLAPDRASLPTGLSLWFGILNAPRETLEAWGDDLPLGSAVAVLLVLAGLFSLLLSGPSLAAVALGVPVVLGFLVIGWASSASLGYLAGSLAGGRAALPAYLAAVAFSMLPLLFLPTLLVAFGWGGLWRAGAVVGLLGLLAWGSRLSQLALSVTLGLGDGRAMLVGAWALLAFLALPALYLALVIALGVWVSL